MDCLLLCSLNAMQGGAAAFRSSQGLCVRHLVQTLDAGDPAGGIPTLIERQREVWQGLEAELAEFIRKNDYQFTGEPIGYERRLAASFPYPRRLKFGQHLR